MAKLTFVLEDGQEIVVPLAERITLGRADDNDVVVDDERISKRHAELVRNADGTVQLFDSASTAGTFVNGERVTTLTVRHGDKLAFGPLQAVLDLEEMVANGSVTPAPEVVAAETKAKETKAKEAKSVETNNGKVATRKKGKAGRKNAATVDKPATPPAEEALARQQAKLQEEAARLDEKASVLAQEEEKRQKAAALREESDRLDEKARLQAEEEVQRRQAALKEESARLQDEKARLQDEKMRLQAEEETQRRQAAIREEAARLEAAKVFLKIEEEAQQRQSALREELAILEDKVRAQAEEELRRQQAAIQEEAARLEAEKVRLREEDEIQRRQTALRDELARLEDEKTKLLTEMSEAQKEFLAWQKGAEKERNTLNTRVETLRSAEERLVPMQAAVLQAENAHSEWVKSIKDLAVQHEEKASVLQRLLSQIEQKNADLQQLNKDEAAVRHEIESVVGHRDKAIAHLQQVREECTRDEAALNDRRRQLAEVEQRCQEVKELAEARDDQVKTAEKKLESISQRRAQLETNIKELTGAEERLTQSLAQYQGQLTEAQAQCRDMETRQTELTTAVATISQENQRVEALAKDLEQRIGALQAYHQQMAVVVEEARVMQQRTEGSLQHVREELIAREKELAARNEQIVAETKRLEETQARRAEIDQQCKELAGTEQKLSEAKEQFAAAEKRCAEMKNSIAEHEAQISSLKSSIHVLEGEDAAAEGRLDVLRSREKDLRGELARLATSERAERTRFEEVRQLAAEAEKNHATQKQQLNASLEETRRNLAELMSRLTPLREWKDAMDQLYGRLATLPQDSAEARTLWHEIEKEKTGLVDIINTARVQARAGTAEPLRPITAAVPVRPVEQPGTGTGGVMLPGAAQEVPLRTRLAQLRENVQREETRLEQLRLERVRQESNNRSNPTAESAVMREQNRYLEVKIRQDEERHHALLRNLEASQAEEEKRRDRMADMERKLAELRTDITDAERMRSDLRQQTDLVQTELKNREAALDRILKMTTEACAQA